MVNAIETREVQKNYRGRAGRIQALDRLTMEVREGEIFGFVGPNGAGKTTAIKILLGLAWPDAGEARVFGARCGTVESRLKMGFLPESPVFEDFMTAEELLMLHGELAGIARDRRRQACREALETVRLEERAGSRLREFSKGMLQRFGIAQALVARPPLLVLDEPTGGLDPLAQGEVKSTILDLRSRGVTIFFSSHQLTEVELICDTIGILDRGRLLECSPTRELLRGSDRSEVRLRAEDSVAGLLRDRGLEARRQDDELVVLVPQADVRPLMEAAQAGGGEVVAFGPARRTLEQAFFEIVGRQP